MLSARSRTLAGTALAAILTTSPGVAAPMNSSAPQGIQPAPREYTTPGSMPKPSGLRPADDGIRFRGALPASNDSATSLAPAGHPPRHEPQTKPAAAPAMTKPAETKPIDARAPEPGPAEARTEPKPEATAAQPPKAAPRPAVAETPAAPPAEIRKPAGTVIADAQLADRLRELIGGRQFEHIVPRKSDRDAIAAMYGKNGRNFQPLWVSQGGPSERAKDVTDYLRTIDDDGLDPKDYPVPNFGAGNAESQALAELKFTETLLTYARHALTGRVHFSRVSPNIEYKLAFDADDVLKRIGASTDLAKTLESFNPQQPAYKALKAKYAELRNAPDKSAATHIENGPVLKYFRDRNNREYLMSDPRVPKLRERLGLPAESNTTYNAAVAMAVGKFQKAHGIQVTGQLNAPTIEALNGPSRAKQIDAMIATLERWRWIPRDLGKTHVVLNIPDYNLRVYHGGEKVWQTRVVVGKPTQATPLLTETMKYITVNPTWNVPQSIIYNELLPIYERQDPQIFERMGLKVERERDGNIRVYQPPGERNALGQMRFNFPNKFLVYQHDTPERHYFAYEKRAYSHGCMRVQDPMKYAEVLLSFAAPRGNYTVAGLQRMLGGQEQQIDFQTQIPVHITYQTAFVDEAGKLQFREDIYGLDAKLVSILKGSERAVADVGVERPADPNFKPTPEQGQRLRSAASGVGSPFGLFDQLFR